MSAPVVQRGQLRSNNLEKNSLIYKALMGYRGHCLSLVATEQISEANRKKNYHKIKFCNIFPSTKVSAKTTRKPKDYNSSVYKHLPTRRIVGSKHTAG